MQNGQICIVHRLEYGAVDGRIVQLATVGEFGAGYFILAFHTFQLHNNKLENEFSTI